MTENEKYIFDLLGFIVVPNALTTEQITDMNALMDKQIEKESTTKRATVKQTRQQIKT